MRSIARAQFAEGGGSLPPKGNAPDDRSGPKLCPDPSVEDISGRSENSLAYQEYVSGLPRGLEVELGGVSFDGCREADGVMLEAKARYAQSLGADGEWKDFFTGSNALEAQMEDQSETAAAYGRQVEWHVQEKAVADWFRAYANDSGYNNVEVIFDPGPAP